MENIQIKWKIDQTPSTSPSICSSNSRAERVNKPEMFVFNLIIIVLGLEDEFSVRKNTKNTVKID